jgi:hypothetical protein
LVIASRPEVDLVERNALLSRLIEHGAGLRAGPGEEDPKAIAAGIVLLAETRLAMKRPETALVALDALPPSPPGVDTAKLLRLRVIALLWTNHISDAEAIGAPLVDWLDGLEAALSEPHARSILTAIRSRFGGVLPEPDGSRMAALAERLRTGNPDERATVPDKPDQH